MPEKDEKDCFIKERVYFEKAKVVIEGEIKGLEEGIYKKKEEKKDDV